eukprot:1160495-Pelagomonas_calceolata.AAC.8
MEDSADAAELGFHAHLLLRTQADEPLGSVFPQTTSAAFADRHADNEARDMWCTLFITGMYAGTNALKVSKGQCSHEQKGLCPHERRWPTLTWNEEVNACMEKKAKIVVFIKTGT